ncbi:hypothetical protein [Streptomyces sp. SID8352]|uniref:hypothetical protein n=1 Tax=Streptomyces sp. SID8352 TaxID=2690338 RepID=UPI00136EA6CA|nr:hypothetical protein [Streptomyces sp. SID8352]MYU20953.1 hypothetical protein [Streptomyces sp. SID8352]
MYLVHARLRAPTGQRIPSRAAEFVTRQAREADRLEHVSVHESGDDWVLGLFFTAETLAEAEGNAVRLCGRALEADGPLRGWVLLGSGAALIDAPWDPWAGSGPGPTGGGRLMPLPDLSTRKPFPPL